MVSNYEKFSFGFHYKNNQFLVLTINYERRNMSLVICCFLSNFKDSLEIAAICVFKDICRELKSKKLKKTGRKKMLTFPLRDFFLILYENYSECFEVIGENKYSDSSLKICFLFL